MTDKVPVCVPVFGTFTRADHKYKSDPVVSCAPLGILLPVCVRWGWILLVAFCAQVQTQLSMSVSKVLFEWGGNGH